MQRQGKFDIKSSSFDGEAKPARPWIRLKKEEVRIRSRAELLEMREQWRRQRQSETANLSEYLCNIIDTG
ncbi:Hypothetical predicted protein [Octopus vulgaris]|uniref:Uncharacterized protein n=1 Tax=Octopus vulgaris TaxID=6645 RepID=A0AA36ALT8_OCTVU|nr:Hypothetical predicted protein [Octopus vulgaris]